MFRALNSIAMEYDWRVVAVAVLVCASASLMALHLLRRAQVLSGSARALSIAASGTAIGFSIWATHFIAMLAYNPGVPVAYTIGFTLLSLLTAVSVTSLGLATASAGSAWWAAPVGGAIVGVGVGATHYVGLWAIEVPGRVTWDMSPVAASTAIGILFAILLAMGALTLASRRRSPQATLTVTTLLTLAIVSDHFATMGAVGIVADPARSISALSLVPGLLAVAVACVAVAVLSLCLAVNFIDRRHGEEHQQIATAFDHMSQGLGMFDPEGRLLLVNNRYREMYGLSADGGAGETRRYAA